MPEEVILKIGLDVYFDEFMSRLKKVAGRELDKSFYTSGPLMGADKSDVDEYISCLLFIRLFRCISTIKSKVFDKHGSMDLYISLIADIGANKDTITPERSPVVQNWLSSTQNWGNELKSDCVKFFLSFSEIESVLVEAIKSIRFNDFDALLVDDETFYAFGKVIDMEKTPWEVAKLLGEKAVEDYESDVARQQFESYKQNVKAKNKERSNVKDAQKSSTIDLVDLKDMLLTNYASNCVKKIHLDHMEHSMTVIPAQEVEDAFLEDQEDLFMGQFNAKKLEGTKAAILDYFHMTYPMPIKIFEENNLAAFNELLIHFPNFYEVTVYIRDYCLYSITRNVPLKIPNIILIGNPGVGKSAYAIALSEAIDMAYDLIPISGLTASMELSGLSGMWGNGQPGLVFEAFSNSQIGNPIIILDEIDKASGTGGNSLPPTNVLLSMTEEKTARTFRESFFKFEMDLSHVNWIATANDRFNIMPPLLSRFKKFDIKPPSKDEVPAVFNSIYRNVLKKHKLVDEFIEQLSDRVIELLGEKPLRNVKENIERAVVKTIIRPLSVDGKYQLVPGIFKEETKLRKVF